MTAPMTLIVITAEGESQQLGCDSVTLFSKDNARGENGGSMGIRRGHMPAVIALEPDSKLKAMLQGSPVYEAEVVCGFASVKDDVVTVVGSMR